MTDSAWLPTFGALPSPYISARADNGPTDAAAAPAAPTRKSRRLGAARPEPGTWRASPSETAATSSPMEQKSPRRKK
eukprot:CAMPEP_0206155130 /NCGR_PEP_ID=MMETSP1474-20131121/1908_1 /ASSEMBLY_ACC=CAM_ASM_001110 /TAXON_ID=97495 /ORGANISM="Imantonia sp., Strain RCC918" /LENGTH=76 /DNA_ID=CAMNT_0053553663 /DNA_START=478 /DNA_END=705 /DNA_ORIENTATION=+